ncbi:MAG TPA: ribosome small subunit-dependent GTPase A [Holophaga sp.]|nr:ribosome small subunit-dependent GTPase A [Holophaga sp.]
MHTHASNPASDRRIESSATLRAYGWRPEDLPDPCPTGLEPARILAYSRGLALVQTESGEAWCSLTGRCRTALHAENQQPCAGDWAMVQQQVGRGQLHALLPRRTLLARQESGPSGRAQPLAAQVDQVLIALGLDRDYNPARLERLLALAWASGAAPLVLLTKADRVEEPERWVHHTEAFAAGAPVLAVSTVTGFGLETFRERLPGRTSVLVGSSGVGKSTLLNALMGTEARATQAVRASDGRGRHTTALRELFLLPGGGCLIDTPGLREVGLLAEADLGSAFSEVEVLASGCRYRDCAHGAEPGCAVQAALSEGLLDPARYDSYLRLRRERDYAAARSDERLWREREQRWKGIAQQIRKLGKG